MQETPRAQGASAPLSELAIRDIEAYAVSFPVPVQNSVTLGVGRAVKRDAVIVKVTTAGGLAGIGVEVDEAFIAAHPPIEGPAYV